MNIRTSCLTGCQVSQVAQVPVSLATSTTQSSRFIDSVCEVQTLNSNSELLGLKVMVAIENVLIRLDIQDTLWELGIVQTCSASTAAQAIAHIGKDCCDVFILGLEGTNPECQRLVDELERFGIPIIIVTNGVNFVETLPRISHTENLGVPFDSDSLRAALNRTRRSVLKPPDAT